MIEATCASVITQIELCLSGRSGQQVKSMCDHMETTPDGFKMALGSDNFNSDLFIEEIQKYECLYNKLCKDYKKEFIRLNCWGKNQGKVSGYSRQSRKEV